MESMRRGGLVAVGRINEIIKEALQRAKDIDRVILDGFPRQLEQAQWLVESREEHGRAIGLAIVLEVPREQLEERLRLRGRIDDTPDAIEERLNIYRKEIYPILTYLTDQKIRITHLDGTGTVGQVHDRVEAELSACSLV